MRIQMVWKQSRSRLLAFLHDSLMVPVAWISALFIHENSHLMTLESVYLALLPLPFIAVVQMLSFIWFHLYRGMWRYTSMKDLIRIVGSVTIGSAVAFTFLFFIPDFASLPRSVLVLYPLLLIGALSVSRIVIRFIRDKKGLEGAVGDKRVLIVGAGHAAESLIRDLLRPPYRNQFQVVALVDENPTQMGRDIHGIRVLGNFESIPELVKEHAVERIMLALPDADAETMRYLLEMTQKTPCLVSTLPSVNDLVDGRVSIEHLRGLSIEDLLGRTPVQLDWKAIQSSIQGKRILVSGGGGSIGSELCRQIARLEPESLIIVDNSEYHLFQLQQEFNEHFPDLKITYHLVDVTDEVGIQWVLKQHTPHSVYHAAAYKHVPLLENQIREAVFNNVIGTENVVRAAVLAGVQRFLLVSTDKAVNPTNIMGASKRVAEIVCQQYQYHYPKMQFTIVRFGNVLGSRGSVVETFKAQIAKGGPVTVTHPEVKRYFMTIPEACQLILQAASMKGGEIFVLDMGEPVKIKHLAEQMIQLAGKVPEQEMKIRYTGLRPGEKLFEELFHDRENFSKTTHPKLWVARTRSLNHSEIAQMLLNLKTACQAYEVQQLNAVLKDLVPEFQNHKNNVLGVLDEALA